MPFEFNAGIKTGRGIGVKHASRDLYPSIRNIGHVVDIPRPPPIQYRFAIVNRKFITYSIVPSFTAAASHSGEISANRSCT